MQKGTESFPGMEDDGFENHFEKAEEETVSLIMRTPANELTAKSERKRVFRGIYTCFC